MTNEELLFLLTKYQNSHYKYKMRTKKPFILFIKNKNFPRKVFYVRYTDDRIVLSTGETEFKKAEKFAIEHLENHTKDGIKERKQADEFHKYLLEYYEENSIHIDYCNQHNRKVSTKERKSYESMMRIICTLTPDVRKFNQLDKQRLIKLQSDLLENGKSVKTIKNYLDKKVASLVEERIEEYELRKLAEEEKTKELLDEDKEEDFEEAISAIWESEKKYDPSVVGYKWDKENPRIQLEPRGERGYIELVAVKAQ